MTRHVALDLALEWTGLAWPGGHDVLHCKGMTGTRRLRWWAGQLQPFLRAHIADEGIDTVVVGAPFIYGKNGMAGMIGTLKLYGVAELIAGNLGLRWVEVADTSARASVIGKGAKKPDVLPWARSLGLDLRDDRKGDGDVADAVLFWHWWADRELVRGRSAPLLGTGAR